MYIDVSLYICVRIRALGLTLISPPNVIYAPISYRCISIYIDVSPYACVYVHFAKMSFACRPNMALRIKSG